MSVIEQSNAGGWGDGLDPTIFTTNLGPSEPVLMQERTTGLYQLNIPTGQQESKFQITWRGFTDNTTQERFLEGLTQATMLYNYYILVKVEYC